MDNEEIKETLKEESTGGPSAQVRPPQEKLCSMHRRERTFTSPAWIPGVVELQFYDWVEVKILTPPLAKTFAFESEANKRPLTRLNRMLKASGIRKIEHTFRTSREESKRYQLTARQRGITLPDLSSIFTLYFNKNKDVERVAQALQKLPEIAVAAPVPRTKPAQESPVDPLLGENDIRVTNYMNGIQNQWYIFRCKVNEAWKREDGGQNLLSGKGVVIVDIDWGFRTTHLDLKDRLHPDHRFNASDCGKEVSKGTQINHGTAVMGLAGAGADGFGMKGVAFEAELWPVQVNVFPEVGPDVWAKAIEWAMRRDSGGKRKVILLEGETLRESNIESVPSIRSVISHALAREIVVCVPAGNGAKDAAIDDKKRAFEPTGSIVVASTRYHAKENHRAAGSNWGASVTVAAPGDRNDDVTCGGMDDDCYVNAFGGTSGAAAKVAGVIALMLQANPHIRHCDIRKILETTGSRLMPPPSEPAGRFLNAEDAVIAAKLAPRWGTGWKALSVTARDIGFGASEGSLWRVGLDNTVSRLRDGVWEADEVAPPAVKIAVEPDGTPWYISTTDDIHAKAGGVWEEVAGKALDIAIGADGSVWRVGLDHSVFRRDGNGWQRVVTIGQAVKIAVDPHGRPWYISKDGHAIFRRNGAVWEQVPGRASDIAIGADGSVWHVGINEPGEEGRMRRWNGVTWEPIDGTATAIAVAPNGLPFYIDNSDYIVERV